MNGCRQRGELRSVDALAGGSGPAVPGGLQTLVHLWPWDYPASYAAETPGGGQHRFDYLGVGVVGEYPRGRYDVELGGPDESHPNWPEA